MDIMSMIPQFIGGLVLFIVMVALLLMARGGKKSKKGATVENSQPAALPGGEGAAAALAGRAEGAEIHPEVMNLVQKQPEEIAVLLRSWLADRR